MEPKGVFVKIPDTVLLRNVICLTSALQKIIFESITLALTATILFPSTWKTATLSKLLWISKKAFIQTM